ncbi:hypothetical protein P7K49_018603 [Saguinus oedipus]|uniref:Uncharacterized protein n=1 Tax=Saguinus oedipus TaxID=9490 RepID=A0ABQ9V5U4_SAGOE|nr:hypothetical protein P7K49_018603 [Saguinus oedipus]
MSTKYNKDSKMYRALQTVFAEEGAQDDEGLLDNFVTFFIAETSTDGRRGLQVNGMEEDPLDGSRTCRYPMRLEVASVKARLQGAIP